MGGGFLTPLNAKVSRSYKSAPKMVSDELTVAKIQDFKTHILLLERAFYKILIIIHQRDGGN